MAEELTYKRLRDLVREEKAQPSLVRLPPDFFPSVEAFLSSKYSQMEQERQVLQMREFENAIAVIKEISSIRQQKILFRAIRSAGEHGDTQDMTREEHALYDRFCAVLEDDKKRLDGLVFGYQKAKAALQKQGMGAQEQENKVKKVRFLKEVPAYRGANNETFGPFKAGDEGALPHGEAEWLLRGKLAEALE